MIDTNRRRLALTDLPSFQAVTDPQISPDARHVAFVVETMNLETNQLRARIWFVEIDSGAAPCLLTNGSGQDSLPRWSPDGQTLAFVSNRGGKQQIWLQVLDGAEPRQVTSHPLGAWEPVWSPDGQHLAFLALGPNRRGDPLVVPEQDDCRRVVRIVEHRHKRDGIGFFGPYRSHVWMTGLNGETARQITDGPFDDQSPAWSPDGGRIAFVSDRSVGRDQHYGAGAVHVVDLATGKERCLTPQGERAAHPSWSPDGTRLAYAGCVLPDEASPANTHLWIVGSDGEKPRCLTEGQDRSAGQSPGGYLTASPPAWAPDSSSVLYLITNGPSTHLFRLAEGDAVPLTTGRVVVNSFSADRAARRVAFLVGDPVTPSEVWLCQVESAVVEGGPMGRAIDQSSFPPRVTGSESQKDLHTPEAQAPTLTPSQGARVVYPLSNVNVPVLASLSLAHPEDLRLNRPDGMVVEGWLFRPPSPFKTKLPLILVVHGGPHNYFGDAFSFDHQLFAALGYVVLCVNPRGSGGRGESFARAVCGDWGGKDFEDLMAMLDHIIARGDPPIDEKRLGITGSSYGGYMTCWAITRTNRFAAAVAGACLSNLISYFSTSEIGSSWNSREFGGVPEERLDWYLARSPVLHASRVETPLLLYHGEEDLTCPIEQSEQMFSALRRLGKTVEFLRVPTEGHGVLSGSPTHRIDVRDAILDWFSRMLDR